MHVTNREVFGHLINSDEFYPDKLHSELYQIFNNPADWEHRYIHENYSHALAEGSTIEQVGRQNQTFLAKY